MQFQITKGDPVKQVCLKPGWDVVNDTDFYLDIERNLFSFQRRCDSGETTYVNMRITFVRPAAYAHEYQSAYIVHELNVPDGDHDVTDQINVSVEEAMRLCFMEESCR